MTAVSTPAGNSTDTFFRLCSAAFFTGSLPEGVRGVVLSFVGALSALPVAVDDLRSAATVPSNTTSPPCTPAPGPRSTTWSAIAMTSGSCSTTRTVFPRSLNAFSSAVSLPTSCGCRPVLGSSKM